MAQVRLYFSMMESSSLVMLKLQLRDHSRTAVSMLKVVNELQSIGFDVYTTDQSGITLGGEPSLALALVKSAQETGALAPVLSDELMLELLPSVEVAKKRAMEMLMLYIERVETPPTRSLH